MYLDYETGNVLNFTCVGGFGIFCETARYERWKNSLSYAIKFVTAFCYSITAVWFIFVQRRIKHCIILVTLNISDDGK